MSGPSSPKDTGVSSSSSTIASARRPSGTTTRQRPAVAPTGPRKPTSRAATSLASPSPTARQFVSIDQARAADRPASSSQPTTESQALQALPPLPTSPPPRPPCEAAAALNHGSRSGTPAAVLSSPTAASEHIQSPSASPRVSSPVSEELHSQGTSLPYLQPESKPSSPTPGSSVPSPVVERMPVPISPPPPPSSAPTPTPILVFPALAPPRIPSFASALAPSSFRKKALTLSAAQWTLTSADLQAIVSRAIRSSAEPSSIRLLPLDVLDKEIAEEETKLESERLDAMGRYRLGVHRRAMFLRGLSGLLPSAGSSSSSTTASDILSNLSTLSASLDDDAETILRTSAQLADLCALREAHASSALSVALRKLNASFARRTRDLGALKDELEQLRAERDEAWRVAEDLAKEMDERADWEDLEGEEFDDLTEEVVNAQRVVAAPATATLTRVSRIGVKLRVPGVGPRVVTPSNSPIKRRPSPLSAVSITPPPPSEPQEKSELSEQAERTEQTEKAGQTGQTEQAEQAEHPEHPKTRARSNSAASRVSAARKRSIRQSKASLRIPRDLLANANAGSSASTRPKSSYSTHSQGSMRSRSRARARIATATGSAPSSPLDGIDKHPPLPVHSTSSPVSMSINSASPQTETQMNDQIPQVPKIPAELLFNLHTPASSASAPRIRPPLPPIPPDASPTSLTLGNGASFLDMITRPSSRMGSSGETAGRTPIELTGEGLERVRRSLGEIVTKSASAGEREGAVASGANGGESRAEDYNNSSGGDGDQSVMGSPSLPNPFSPSSIMPSTTASQRLPSPSRSLQIRHPLSPHRPRDRPPPDSPIDVAHSRSGLGFPDGDVEDDDDDELVGSFADAYAYEYGPARARVQQTQSMLALPTTRNNVSDTDVTTTTSANNGNNNTNNNNINGGNGARARNRTLHHVASFAGPIPGSSSAEVMFFAPPSLASGFATATGTRTGSGSTTTATSQSPSSEKRNSKSPLSPAYKEAYPFSRPMSDGAGSANRGLIGPVSNLVSLHPGAVVLSAPVDVTTFDGKVKKTESKRPTSMPMSVMTSSSSENEKPWGYF